MSNEQLERRRLVNKLAHIFYTMHGYMISDSYDFSKAADVRELAMWKLAEASYQFWQLHGVAQMKRRNGSKIHKGDEGARWRTFCNSATIAPLVVPHWENVTCKKCLRLKFLYDSQRIIP